MKLILFFSLLLLNICFIKSIQIIVLLYSDSTKSWNDLMKAAESVNLIVVLKKPDNITAEYAYDFNRLSLSGALLLGYVPTDFGTRPIEEVKTEVRDLAHGRLKYNGAYLDYASNDINKVTYYKEIYNYTKTIFGCTCKVFTAQGVPVPSAYFGDDKKRATDTAVVFEDSFDNWQNFKSADHYFTMSETELAAIVHSCHTVDDMKKVVDEAIEQNIGYIYVTDKSLNNPYDSLSTYFLKMVEYVASL